MATIVEDGSQVENANSYVSVADFQTYLDDRNITLSGDAALRLLQAMDYLESLSFIGTKKSSTQALQWPRYYVTIDGWYVENTTIPKELKNAQMAVAVAIDSGAGPLENQSKVIKSAKVGPISVEYADSSTNQAISKAIPASLWKLINGGYGYLHVTKA